MKISPIKDKFVAVVLTGDQRDGGEQWQGHWYVYDKAPAEGVVAIARGTTGYYSRITTADSAAGGEAIDKILEMEGQVAVKGYTDFDGKEI